MADIQFNRWKCPQCGGDGVESWNKSMHDGLDYGGDYPNPATFGHYCLAEPCCGADLVVCYGGPQDVPRALIVGQLHHEISSEKLAGIDGGYAKFAADPNAGQALEMSDTLDGDWSRGCLDVRPVEPVS